MRPAEESRADILAGLVVEDLGLVGDCYVTTVTGTYCGREVDHRIEVDRGIAERLGAQRVRYEIGLGLDALCERLLEGS